MKEAKQLITDLLIQYMKHEQLMEGLVKLGFQNDVHRLDGSGIILELMGRTEDSMSWEWFDLYMEHIGRAASREITATGENLRALAESCYVYLKAQLDMEKA